MYAIKKNIHVMILSFNRKKEAQNEENKQIVFFKMFLLSLPIDTTYQQYNM